MVNLPQMDVIRICILTPFGSQMAYYPSLGPPPLQPKVAKADGRSTHNSKEEQVAFIAVVIQYSFVDVVMCSIAH